MSSVNGSGAYKREGDKLIYVGPLSSDAVLGDLPVRRKEMDKCPKCGGFSVARLTGNDGYVYFAICKDCEYEFNLSERLAIQKR